jgi:hypothetical protein
MSTPKGVLYICLTCGNWHVADFRERQAMKEGSALQPVCVSCEQIMYNVRASDGLELMEDAEPEPLEKLHPFDARIFLSDEACMASPMLRDIRNWITGTLEKSLEDVMYLNIAQPPIDTGIRDFRVPSFVSGYMVYFTVRFKGETGEHLKTVNRNDYVDCSE